MGSNGQLKWWYLWSCFCPKWIHTYRYPGDHREVTECWSSGEPSCKRFSYINYLYVDLALYALRSPRKNVVIRKESLGLSHWDEDRASQKSGTGRRIQHQRLNRNSQRGKRKTKRALCSQSLKKEWRKNVFQKGGSGQWSHMLLSSNCRLDASFSVGKWASRAMRGLVWTSLWSHCFPIWKHIFLGHPERGGETPLMHFFKKTNFLSLFFPF